MAFNNSMNYTAPDLGPVYKWLVPALWVILSVAFVGNLLILISSRWLQNEISPHLRLCISLAAADAWAACLIIIGLLINSYLPAVYNYEYGKPFTCYLLIFEMVRVGSMLTSDFHLFALAVNQFYSILAPLKYKVNMTSNCVRLILFILWLAPLSCLFLYCFIAPGEGFLYEGCPRQFYFMFGFRFSIFLLFTIPLLATVIVYILILYHVFNESHDNSSTPLRRSFKAGNEDETSKRSPKRAIVTTMLIVVTFCFSWFPCVLYFTLVCKDCPLKEIPLITHLVLNVTLKCLVIIKLTVNPFIYTLRMNPVRAALQVMADTRCGSVSRNNYVPMTLHRMACLSMSIGANQYATKNKILDTQSCTSI